MDHAHFQGILHRDIKPANLMLDAGGRLWITDFGLARMESAAGITLTGDLLGTLRYMPPEQALAKPMVIDYRADIYSLGATLYELLTLRPVFDGDDRESVLNQIAFAEPSSPRKLVQALPVDLDTIVLKALAKDRDDRYSSAAEMRDDLYAFLEHRPLKARPPLLADRLFKWSRRHQSIVWTVLAVSLLAVVGLSIATALIAQQRDYANQQRLRAEWHRERAESNLGKTMFSMQALLGRLNHSELPDSPEMDQLRHDMFAHSEAFLAQLTDADRADRDLAAQAAGAYIHLGRLYWGWGRPEDADRAYRAAVVTNLGLVEQFPADHRLWVSLGTSSTIRGDHLLASGKVAQSKVEYRKAQEAFRQAVVLRPDDPCSLENWAFFLTSCPDPEFHDDARALDLALKAVELDPDGPRWGTLGMAYLRAGQWSRAAECLKKSMARNSQSYEVHWHDKTGQMFGLPIAYWWIGDAKRARRCYDEAAAWLDRYAPGTSLPLQREAAQLLGIDKGERRVPE